MLTEADNLLTFAEIAVAFAGFAALAGVIGRSRNRDSAQLDIEKLRGVIYGSLLIVVTAMLPVVVAKYLVLESAVWRISSVITLLLNWIGIVVVWRHAHRSVARAADDKLTTWTLFTLEVALELPLIANALGLFSAYAPAFYFTYLIVGICSTAFLFLRLVDSMFSHETGE